MRLRFVMCAPTRRGSHDRRSQADQKCRPNDGSKGRFQGRLVRVVTRVYARNSCARGIAGLATVRAGIAPRKSFSSIEERARRYQDATE